MARAPSEEVAAAPVASAVAVVADAWTGSAKEKKG